LTLEREVDAQLALDRIDRAITLAAGGVDQLARASAGRRRTCAEEMTVAALLEITRQLEAVRKRFEEQDAGADEDDWLSAGCLR
jgi:hypothetical protein